MRSPFAILLCVLFVSVPASADEKPFPWKDGDKVAWIGGTVIERERTFGHWEPL